MRAKELPGFLWLFEDLLDDAARDALAVAAKRAGLDHAFPGTGMAGDLLPLPEPTHPHLTFERVTTEDQLRAYADINSRAYGFELADGRDGLLGSGLWKNDVFAYLARRAGGGRGERADRRLPVRGPGRHRAVLAAAGYGEAVTRKAMHEGARATGLTRATLHATEAGRPVYERIGFLPNSPIHFHELPD
ncbi:hypothetical protein BCF44_108253 [Kutzneria buriramensis]|uniref:Acetyltransferase (GNAT) family protein n=2 Tax=Kutzneria buriramensis TaxID=1045776 RepID=A0A3E0HGH0_9PSEU|nr:hypothetical protein BCF44_108253 [Kutzneria buriramensis]